MVRLHGEMQCRVAVAVLSPGVRGQPESMELCVLLFRHVSNSCSLLVLGEKRQQS